jgi:hypothetical protein
VAQSTRIITIREKRLIKKLDTNLISHFSDFVFVHEYVCVCTEAKVDVVSFDPFLPKHHFVRGWPQNNRCCRCEMRRQVTCGGSSHMVLQQLKIKLLCADFEMTMAILFAILCEWKMFGKPDDAKLLSSNNKEKFVGISCFSGNFL